MPGWGTSWGTGWGGTSRQPTGLVLTGSISFDSAATTIITGNYTAGGSLTFTSIDTLTLAASGGVQLASLVLDAISTLTLIIREDNFVPKIIVPQKLLLKPKVAIFKRN